MVRTKKQVIEKYAKIQNQHYSPPPLIVHEKEISDSFFNIQKHDLMTAATNEKPVFFQPPYVMNNFWPPPLPTATKVGQKIETMFSNICKNEVNEMLIDCAYNEDDVILKLITQTDYLDKIRQRIQQNTKKNKDIKITTTRPIETKKQAKDEPKPSSSPKQVQLQSKLPLLQPLPTPVAQLPTLTETIIQQEIKPLDKATPTAITTTNTTDIITPKNTIKPDIKTSDTIKHCRSGSSRLTLDDALKQINERPEDAFEGWSSARLRAYKMIDKNPNSYYYRFNAPGEQQKKGKWSEQETELFLERLKQVGANSQWGIFSMSIPGRVGYQCSNYYRFMIESGHLHDPNYVLDQSGKARYLFDKKTSDGHVEKTFRKHSKHTTHQPTKKREIPDSDDSDDNDPSFSIKGPKKKKPLPKKKKKRAKHEGDVTDHVVPI